MAESAAFNVKPSPNAPNSSAEPPPQKVIQSAGFMVEPRLDLRQSKADNVALKLNESMAMKRAKHDQIGVVLCVGSGYWRT